MASWLEFMEIRIKGNEKSVPWYLHDKIACNKWCARMGYPTPELGSVFNCASEISLNLSFEEFVLKPTKLSSTRGVMVLKSVDGGYFDSMSGKKFSAQEIIRAQFELEKKYAVKNNKWIVEERVKDAEGYEIPLDFKAYAFRGKVELFLVIDRSTKPTSVAWFDGDLRPIPSRNIRLNPKYVQQLDVADSLKWGDLVSMSKDVSSMVNSPFARIDLYNSVRGPLLGEVTLTPGGLYYGDHYEMAGAMDSLMGARWLIASDEIAESRDALSRLAYAKRFYECDAPERRNIVNLMNYPYKLTKIMNT